MSDELTEQQVRFAYDDLIAKHFTGDVVLAAAREIVSLRADLAAEKARHVEHLKYCDEYVKRTDAHQDYLGEELDRLIAALAFAESEREGFRVECEQAKRDCNTASDLHQSAVTILARICRWFYRTDAPNRHVHDSRCNVYLVAEIDDCIEPMLRASAAYRQEREGAGRFDRSNEPAPHDWSEPGWRGFRWPTCKTCGIVRRADDKNSPCKGPTKLRPLLPTEMTEGGSDDQQG